MKTRMAIGVAVLLVLAPTNLYPQAEVVGIFSDLAYTDCTLLDDLVSPRSIYVVHKNTSGAVSVRFRVEVGGGFTGVFLWFDAPGINLGDPFTGMTISYGTCMSGDVPFMTLHWMCDGSSPDCAWLRIVADPQAESGLIEAVDCSSNTFYPTGGVMSVNPVVGVCFGPPGGILGCHLPPVPATEHTWGYIKALYH
jgi:hypothetical protein